MLKNMQYLVQLNHHHLAWKTFREAYELAKEGKDSLVQEVCQVLHRLPISVSWEVPEFEDLTVEHLQELMRRVIRSMEIWLHDKLMASPRTSDSLKNRLWYDNKQKKMVFQVMAFRHYLRVPTGHHRRALIQIVTGNHQLAIERLRWNERNRPAIPREERLCRFCKSQIEDPAHALSECTGNDDLKALRGRFMENVIKGLPQYRKQYGNAWEMFRTLLADERVTDLLAKLCYNVLEVYYSADSRLDT